MRSRVGEVIEFPCLGGDIYIYPKTLLSDTSYRKAATAKWDFLVLLICRLFYTSAIATNVFILSLILSSSYNGHLTVSHSGSGCNLAWRFQRHVSQALLFLLIACFQHYVRKFFSRENPSVSVSSEMILDFWYRGLLIRMKDNMQAKIGKWQQCTQRHDTYLTKIGRWMNARDSTHTSFQKTAMCGAS